MICCVVSESLGTAALSDYIDQQDYISQHHPGATVHNNNFIGIASYNIFVGVYVATIFGSAFFFDLFWPERKESPSVTLAWRICSVLACLFTLSCALAYTVILATASAYVSGATSGQAQQYVADYGGSSTMRYRDNPRGVASVVFLWPGTVATFASTYILWRSLAHIDAYGPKSTHAKTRDGVIQEKPVDSSSLNADAPGVTAPDASYSRPESAAHTAPAPRAYEGV